MADTYSQIATDSRRKVLDLIYKAQTSHIGSNFSCAEIMAVIFGEMDLSKDVFILSAGWKAAMLYYHLHRLGKITDAELDSYCQPGSKFIGLTEPVIPEIKIAGGSMGLGLPGAVGIALAKKISKQEGRVFVLMSDGEMAIGTTWESALIAKHHKLDNLVVIVDNNGFQAMGETRDVLDVAPIDDKWRSFGWEVSLVDGHNADVLKDSMNLPTYRNWPFIVLASTTKGKGVSFMEDNNLYHYKQLNESEYNNAKHELWEK